MDMVTFIKVFMVGFFVISDMATFRITCHIWCLNNSSWTQTKEVLLSRTTPWDRDLFISELGPLSSLWFGVRQANSRPWGVWQERQDQNTSMTNFQRNMVTNFFHGRTPLTLCQPPKTTFNTNFPDMHHQKHNFPDKEGIALFIGPHRGWYPETLSGCTPSLFYGKLFPPVREMNVVGFMRLLRILDMDKKATENVWRSHVDQGRRFFEFAEPLKNPPGVGGVGGGGVCVRGVWWCVWKRS